MVLCWDNELERYGYLGLLMPIALMGLITNTFSIFVLMQNPFKARVTAYTLLRAMAVTDFIACLLIFPIGLCRCIEPTETWQIYMQQFYEVYIYLPIANGFITVSIYLMMVVSIERYMSVAYALTAKHIWTRRFTSLVILGCYVSGLVINIPYFFLREIRDDPPPGYTDWGRSKGKLISIFLYYFM